jgi:predicted transcriptional regulator
MKASVTTLLAEKAHNIYSINASASVLDAVNEMNHRGVGSIIVLDEGKLVGDQICFGTGLQSTVR